MTYYKQITNRLFYGEWPYKITVQIDGVSHLRNFKNLNVSENSLSNFRHSYRPYTRLSTLDLEKLLNFCKILKEYLDKDIKIRYEGRRANIYIKENSNYNELISKLEKYVVAVTEPKSQLDLEKLLESKKYTLCDKLPYGKYQYKISFKDMPSQTKINLMLWAKKYSEDEIKITKNTEKYFNTGKTYYGQCYCYVKDKNMALLVSMASQGNIRKTEEFVVRNNIK